MIDRPALRRFIRESNRIEGIHTVRCCEVHAHEDLLSGDLTVDAVEAFVERVAGAFLRTVVGMDVRVGSHVAPPGGPDIEPALAKILRLATRHRGDEHAAYTLHQRYETLHPFEDGNGRSGRAIWLWMLQGTAVAERLSFLHAWYYASLAWGGAR